MTVCSASLEFVGHLYLLNFSENHIALACESVNSDWPLALVNRSTEKRNTSKFETKAKVKMNSLLGARMHFEKQHSRQPLSN